ncbi:phage tail assembly protein [Amorphus sp. 3PC139-8]|uniref:phage tail assembly protein n=1 Tax=Amorphus sp. 3PC139-8 TaxID=2735676 RepID=UPI00345D771B
MSAAKASEAALTASDASDDDGLTLPLSKPIQAHGEEVKRLTLRELEPTDILACGNPIVVLAEEGAFRFDQKVMHRLMARVCGVPPSSLERMALSDYMALQNLVNGFFGTGET